MKRRSRTVAALALVLTSLGLLGGCGDEGPTGPQFRDLVFSPEKVILVGDERDAVFVLRNVRAGDLGSVEIGREDAVIRILPPDSMCNAMEMDITPSLVSSLAEGAEVTIDVAIDLSGPIIANDPTRCPVGRYLTTIFASANDRILGVGKIEFDWDGTPP